MKIKSKILEIQFLAMQCTELGHHCFTNYAGHINKFSIDLHEGEWESNSEPLTQDFKVEDSEESLEKAHRIIYQLRFFLRKKKINYERLIQIERVSYDYRL